MKNTTPNHNCMKPNGILKNTLGAGLLLVFLTPTHCDNASFSDNSTKEATVKYKKSNKTFVDKDGMVWHIYSNYERGQDTATDDANQYGLFY